MSNLKEMFTAIDRMQPEEVISFYNEDASYRFGNAPAIVGREAIKEIIRQGNLMIKGIHHNISGWWEENDTTLVEGVIDYTRHDDKVISLPFVSVLRLKNQLCQDVRIYTDISPLFAA
jgi:hypothetical protein